MAAWASFVMVVGRLTLLLFLFAVATPSHALRFSIAAAPPFVYIQVGTGDLATYGLFGGPSSQVDEVSFPIPAGVTAGDGTEIIGTPVMPIAFLGYSGGNQANYQVTIDSSSGLISENNDVIPLSQIRWTTQDGDIPGGQFTGSPNQFLQQYNLRGRRSRGIVDYLTFIYTNTIVPQAGTYRGRVTFTMTLL